MVNAVFYQLTTQWFLYDQCFVLSTNNTMVSLWSMPCFINQQHNGFFMVNALFYQLTTQWFLYDQCFVL